jgi:hypothetical protein
VITETNIGAAKNRDMERTGKGNGKCGGFKK